MNMRILFINTKKANCSIYKSGTAFYECVKSIGVDYVEIDQIDVDCLYRNLVKINDVFVQPYDVYIFNYHHATMRDWEGVDSSRFTGLMGKKINFLLEMLPNDPTVQLRGRDFDAHLVLDPTMVYSETNFYAYPRPISYRLDTGIHNDIPIIGSFGFASDSKRFDLVVDAVNKEFDQAIVRINIPPATYADHDRSFAQFIKHSCEQIAKPGIQIEFTEIFFNDDELINWCASNTLNFFYYERKHPGLCAAIDQCIAARKPILTNNNNITFRHILKYQPYYPDCSIREMIGYGTKFVDMMYSDWNSEICQRRLLEIINV